LISYKAVYSLQVASLLSLPPHLNGFSGWRISVLFEEIQLSTTETASADIDLLTFAHGAHFFGVICLEGTENTEAEPTTGESDDLLGSESRGEQPSYSSASAVLDINSGRERWPPFDLEAVGESPTLYPPSYNYQSGSQHGVLEPIHHNYDNENVNIFADTNADPFELDSGELRPHWLPTAPRVGAAIGIIYLVTSPAYGDPLHAGELRVGVILEAKFRGRGLARKAVCLAIQKAFKDPICQRVQAVIPDGWGKDRALNLFTHMNFGHEGIRRRAFFNPFIQEYKDVTYMGLLCTDWALQQTSQGRVSAPKSLWDELFLRHQREREELLRWDDRRLKRTISTETVRATINAAESGVETETESESDAESISSPLKKRKLQIATARTMHRDSWDTCNLLSSEEESDVEDFVRAGSTSKRSPSPASSESSAVSVPLSDFTDGSVDWDMLDD